MTMVTMLLTFSLIFLVFVFACVLRDGDVVEDVVDFGERDTADAN